MNIRNHKFTLFNPLYLMQLQLPLYIKVILIFIGALLFLFFLEIASGVLIPLAFSFLLALLLYPVCYKLEEKKVPRALAIIISMILILALMAVVFLVFYFELISFYDEIPIITTRVEHQLVELQQTIEEKTKISSESQVTWLNSNIDRVVENGGDLFSNLLFITSGFLIKVVVVPFYIFFLLYYRDIFKEFVLQVTHPESHEKAAFILRRIQWVIQNYLMGLFTVIFIMAILNTVTLLIIGVNHALFFGVLAAILIIIPYIGVFIGSALPVIYSFAMFDSLWVPLTVMITFAVLQTIEGNFITPNITGSKVSLNPLAAILALFIGAEVWGIAGMIMFVPFVAMAKVVFDQIEPLKPYGLLLGTDKKMSLSDLWSTFTFRNHQKKEKDL